MWFVLFCDLQFAYTAARRHLRNFRLEVKVPVWRFVIFKILGHAQLDNKVSIVDATSNPRFVFYKLLYFSIFLPILLSFFGNHLFSVLNCPLNKYTNLLK